MAELVSIKRNVDVSPGQAAPAVFHCSQGDVGSKLILGLLNNGTTYSIPSGVTVTIEGSESNGSIFTPISATAFGSDITFYLTGEMTAVAGPAICQAVLKSGSNILGTANFTLEVESSPMGADAPPVFTDAGWTWMLNKLNTEFVPALGNETIIDAIDSKADQSDLTALSNTVAGHTGSITVLNNTVNTLNGDVTENRQNIALKLDKNQGTANAGKYLKVAADGNVETAGLDVTTDKTLSIADKAADAKAVGDELDDLKADLTDITNNEKITIAFKDKCLNVANGVVDVNNPQLSTTGYGYVIVSCDAGDVFVVNCVSGATTMGWIFTDASYNVLLQADAKNTTLSDILIKAPTGTKYLIIHDKAPYRASWKNVFLCDKVEDKLDVYTDIPFTITGERINSIGNITNSSGDVITDYYPCEEGQTVEWFGRSYFYSNSAAMCCVAFYDESKQFISGVKQVDGSSATTNQYGKIVTTAPQNAKYVAASTHDPTIKSYCRLYDVADNINSVKLVNTKQTAYENISFLINDYRIDYPNGNIVGSSGCKKTALIPCIEGTKVEWYGCTFWYHGDPVMYCIAFYDAKGEIISGITQIGTSTTSVVGYIITNAPKGTAYVSASSNTMSTDVPTFKVYLNINNLRKGWYYSDKLNDIVRVLKNAEHVKDENSNTVTLLHFSDLHKDTGALERIMSEHAYYGGFIDDAICTGDMVSNTSEQISSWWDENVLTCIGNHDTASYSNNTYDWTALSMADRDAYYIAPFESGWGITHTSGTSYYYKDYATPKVRLIVMDGMLYMASDTTEATAQTAWLESLLSDAITNSYHVLIAIHAPHGGAVAEECSFSRYGQTAMPTYTDCNTPQSVIDAVASAITSGLHFVGYIVGHTHQDNIWDVENDGSQLMYCITCANVSYKGQWKNSDQYRDTTLDAFNIVTIDTANTLVKIIRGGGADIDDHMRTRKAICFNYSTGQKVGEVL